MIDTNRQDSDEKIKTLIKDHREMIALIMNQIKISKPSPYKKY